jgi:O-antigen ligase
VVLPRSELVWVLVAAGAAALLGLVHGVATTAASPFLLPIALAAVAFVAVAWTRPELGVAGAGLALPLELVSLPLPSGALSPSESVFALVGVLYVVRLVVRPDSVRNPSLRDLPIWGLILTVAAGVTVAVDPAPSIRIAILWLLFYLVFLQVQSFGRDQVRLVVGAFVVGAAILGGIGAVSFLGSSNTQTYGGGLYTSSRALGTFEDPNYFASILALVTIPALALVLHRPRRNWWMGVAAAVATAGIVFSLSRGGFVALAGGLLVLLLWNRAQLVLVVVFVAFTVTTVANVNPLLESQQFQTVERRLGTLTGGELQATNRRPQIWGLAVELAFERPVFGIGANEFGRVAGQRSVIEDGSGIENVHNQPLNFLAEQGFAGLLCFVLLFAQLAARAWRALTARVHPADFALALGCAATLTGFLLQALTQSQLRVNIIAAGLFLVAGLLTGAADRAPQARSAGRAGAALP